jgi:hypothetical protein
MLHLLYLVAFTALAFLAIGNLLRSLFTISVDSQQRYSSGEGARGAWGQPPVGSYRNNSVPHPELLDEQGNPLDEPLLVMRSMTVEDAREQLDALYNSSKADNNAETSE